VESLLTSTSALCLFLFFKKRTAYEVS